MLVTFEGIDGSGKTTAVRFVSQMLHDAGADCLTTREPGGSANAERIRDILRTSHGSCWLRTSEVLLFTAARHEHVTTIVNPAIAAGRIVLCDRYIDSTRAYQGDIDAQTRCLIDDLHRRIVGLDPDLTFILDVPVEIAFVRASRRTDDRWMDEGLGRDMRRLRQSFLDIADSEPHRCHIVDARRSSSELARSIADRILQRRPG